MRRLTRELRGEAIEVLEHQSQALGERSAGVDFIRDFDVAALEWAAFEMRSRRFRLGDLA